MARRLEQPIARTRGDKELIMSYLDLRRAIGVLGVSLPVVLAIGAIVIDDVSGIESSISDYHATLMRGVFVGVLWALGVFLYSHIGEVPRPGRKRYEPTDNIAGNMAGAFALGVALFPNSGGGLVDNVHFVSAAALFLVLAYFSLVIFPRSEKADSEDRLPQKSIRLKIYRICGVVMLACLVLIALYNLLLGAESGLADISPVFWLESLALWAFGFSWFIYGETLFGGPRLSR